MSRMLGNGTSGSEEDPAPQGAGSTRLEEQPSRGGSVDDRESLPASPTSPVCPGAAALPARRKVVKLLPFVGPDGHGLARPGRSSSPRVAAAVVDNAPTGSSKCCLRCPARNYVGRNGVAAPLGSATAVTCSGPSLERLWRRRGGGARGGRSNRLRVAVGERHDCDHWICAGGGRERATVADPRAADVV